MKNENFYYSGFRNILPIMTGVIPFGAVVGTVCAEAKLSLFQTMSMNFLVYAGASQLAAIDLMTTHGASAVVIISGLIINLRFLLYSAAMSPIVHRSPFLVKLFCAYSLTDQNYAVMLAHEHKLKTNEDAVRFYLGASTCMVFTWHASVLGGFIFGNFAPASLSLDFAVPLSFVALVLPTLKNKKYIYVAIFSSLLSLFLYFLPYKIGLILTAFFSLSFAIILSRKKNLV